MGDRIEDEGIPGGAVPGQESDGLDFDDIDGIEHRVEELKAAGMESADDGEADPDREIDEFLDEACADDPALAYARRVADKAGCRIALQELETAIEVEGLAIAAMQAVDGEEVDDAELDRLLKVVEAEQEAFMDGLAAIRDAAEDPVIGESIRERLRALCAEHGLKIPDAE